MTVIVTTFKRTDIALINQGFIQQGWSPRLNTLTNYWHEQQQVQRQVFVAWSNQQVAGYITLIPVAQAGPFAHLYPELTDFNVFEKYQRQGIGTELLTTAEAAATQLSAIITLGVGLHSGYGAAQKLYIRHGYQPDGSGGWYQNRPLAPGEKEISGDDLILYLWKENLPI